MVSPNNIIDTDTLLEESSGLTPTFDDVLELYNQRIEFQLHNAKSVPSNNDLGMRAKNIKLKSLTLPWLNGLRIKGNFLGTCGMKSIICD